MQISKVMKVVRFNQGYSQDQAALLLEVTPGYVGLLESGRRTPSMEMLQKFADVMKIPFSFIGILLDLELLEKDYPLWLEAILEGNSRLSTLAVLVKLSDNEFAKSNIINFRQSNYNNKELVYG